MAAKKTEQETVTVTDLNGDEHEVPAGLDGVNPVSPNNPPLKAIPEADREQALAAREAEVKFAEEMAKVSGAGEDAASTNKEDNSPAETVDADGNSPREGQGEKARSTATRKTAASNADTKKKD